MNSDGPRGVGRKFAAAACAAVLGYAMVVAAALPPEIQLPTLLGVPLLFAAVANARGVPPHALGLRARVQPSRRYWAKVAVVAGLLGAALLVLVVRGAASAQALAAQGVPWPVFVTRWLPVVGVLYPIGEELLFRSVLMTGLLAVMAPLPAVLIDGAAFAALHWIYGNADPANNVAGFFFAWAFWRSGTVLVPIAFHVAGNVLAGAFAVIVHHHATELWSLVR